jgi:hypothetical protein
MTAPGNNGAGPLYVIGGLLNGSGPLNGLPK